MPVTHPRSVSHRLATYSLSVPLQSKSTHDRRSFPRFSVTRSVPFRIQMELNENHSSNFIACLLVDLYLSSTAGQPFLTFIFSKPASPCHAWWEKALDKPFGAQSTFTRIDVAHFNENQPTAVTSNEKWVPKARLDNLFEFYGIRHLAITCSTRLFEYSEISPVYRDGMGWGIFPFVRVTTLSNGNW